jgi:hypothetical protein
VTVAFHLPARVLYALALALADRSLVDSPLGDRAEIGNAEKGMSHSNLGMGKIKLSKSCIQMNKYKIT